MGPRPRRGGLKGGRLASGPGTGCPSFASRAKAIKKPRRRHLRVAKPSWLVCQSVAELPGPGFQPLISHNSYSLPPGAVKSFIPPSKAGSLQFPLPAGPGPGAFCPQPGRGKLMAAPIMPSDEIWHAFCLAEGRDSRNFHTMPERDGLCPFHHNLRGVDHGRCAGVALPGGAGVGLVFPLPDFPGCALCRGCGSGTGPASPGSRSAFAEVAGAGGQGPDLRGGQFWSALPGPGAWACRGVRGGGGGARRDACLLAEHPGSAAVSASGLQRGTPRSPGLAGRLSRL